MTPQQWQRVQQLFEDAVHLDHDARLRFLGTKCSDDHTLKHEVLAMLQAHDRNTQFEQRMEEAIGGVLHAPDLPVGQIIGRFRITRLLGHGGMGAVYLAERADEQYQQQVALKIVARGLLYGELPARFRAERQILARLDHPNIARLFDGGHMPDGTPFIVMEYVEGLRIDEYCERNQLSTPARLTLIQQVCTAIHYAHQRLVVHRDLKPANILVTKDGVPKLLDFGIAKLLDADEGAPGSPVTHMRDRVLTPEHASPEQLRGEPVGTVSDVYSLGVLMYELLTGGHPYRFESHSLYEIERAIREQSQVAPSAGVLSGASEAGPTRSRSLARELAGDLDNIVLKAMNHEPERRYTSAAALAQDIQNYLDRRPVLARADTLAYRTRKFIRRNAFAVASATSVTILIAALVTFYTLRVTTERDNAERERQTAARVSEFMINAFKLANPNELPDKEVSARDVLDAAAKHVDEELADEPNVRIATMRSISETYIGMGLLEQARALLVRSVELGRSDPRVNRLALARALESLGNTELSMGRQDESERDFAEALSIRVAINQQKTDEGVRLLSSIAANQRARQKFAEALRTHRQSAELAELLASPDPRVLGQVYMGYGMTYLAAGDIRKAEDYSRRSLPLLKGVVHAGYDLYANSLATLGSALRQQYRTSEAEVIYRELLDRQLQRYGPDHYLIGRAWNNYSLLLSTEGKFQAAETALLESLRILKKNPESNPSTIAVTYYNLGALHRTAGELPRALQDLNASIEVWRTMPGRYASNLVQTLVEKSATFRDLGQLQAAQATFDEAETLASEKVEPEHRCHSYVFKERGALRLARGDIDGAQRDLREAKKMLEKRDDLERLADTGIYLGEAALINNQLNEARVEFSAALDIRRKIFPAGYWAIADARSRLGNVLYIGGDRTQGMAMMSEALTDLRATRIAGNAITEAAERRLQNGLDARSGDNSPALTTQR